MKPRLQAIHPDVLVGVVLISMTVLALIVANSPLRGWYDLLLSTPVVVAVGAGAIDKPLLLWINDGLMALFFLLVGIELKHELTHGHLRERSARVLPLFAAIGGMAIPALVYLAFNAQDPVTRQGWAIPAATDIAFALALFAMLARGLPAEAKVLLLSIAIIDDVGAILIIATLYTADLGVAALGFAALAVAALFGLRKAHVTAAMPYVLVGLVLWVATLKSGVHATLAGVILGVMLPGGPSGLAHKLEHALKPWVLFLVLPVFAFANAGISLADMQLSDLGAPVVLGVLFGLAVGKPVGVLLGVWIADITGAAKRPASLTWPVISGVGALCGVGFTMSLFIGSLAFEHAPAMPLADERLGILLGSVVSAVLAALCFKWQARESVQLADVL